MITSPSAAPVGAAVRLGELFDSCINPSWRFAPQVKRGENKRPTRGDNRRPDDRGSAKWLAPGTALLFSAVVDVVLFSRGYWVPDTTLPNWPVWAAAWAFGPAFYIYWSILRSSEK
ncbi:MAG TPA: hypothetical protein VKL22_05855, partial [Actinomycetota bacterium]|nr:hypothetical protein [Actinomycetota bacterium]